MSNKNRRITDWEINSNLDDEEIVKVKDTAADIYRDIQAPSARSLHAISSAGSRRRRYGAHPHDNAGERTE